MQFGGEFLAFLRLDFDHALADFARVLPRTCELGDFFVRNEEPCRDIVFEPLDADSEIARHTVMSEAAGALEGAMLAGKDGTETGPQSGGAHHITGHRFADSQVIVAGICNCAFLSG